MLVCFTTVFHVFHNKVAFPLADKDEFSRFFDFPKGILSSLTVSVSIFFYCRI